ncbi:hypothetical protein EJB05_15376, partial [Eragrostis curvula]
MPDARRPFPGRCSRVAPTRHDYQGRGKGDQAKTSMGLWNALAFSGLAPEHINGRLTMVSFVSAIAVVASTHNGRLTMVDFVSAIAVEASTHGDGLFAQAASGTGQAWFTYMVAVLPPAVAPLVPLLQGESMDYPNEKNEKQPPVSTLLSLDRSRSLLQFSTFLQILPAMATMSVASFSPLTAGSGAIARPPIAALAPRRRALVVRAQNKDNTGRLVDAFAFSGPAPERINGRLAMVGFVSALAVEASRGDGLLSQAGSGSGLAWFAASAAVLSVASLVPLLQGESAEDRSGGFWSADAEIWNGRFAMVGLVALAATEYLTGTPFINV